MANQAKSNQVIGVLGGTFDPIHHGHLRLAVELYERLHLAKIHLIPTAHPPHRYQPLASSRLRLEMVKAAITGVEGLIADDCELHRKGLSYTIDTLSILREKYSHHSLCLILGMDAFIGLPQWHQWERLITLAHLLVVRRPGILLPEIHQMHDFLLAHQLHTHDNLLHQAAGGIWIEEIPMLNISATQIRNLIATGRNPCYLLPTAVLEIIHSHQLYR